jgi:hypothetical protein
LKDRGEQKAKKLIGREFMATKLIARDRCWVLGAGKERAGRPGGEEAGKPLRDMREN